VEGTAVIETAQSDRTTVITLSRPDKHNALTIELCHRLRDTIDTAIAQRARAVVVTGSGSSFCSGADLDEIDNSEFRHALYAMLHSVTEAPMPVIATVNGPAIGAGTQLAIAADLRVLTPHARFAMPAARLGLAVDPWTIRRLATVAGDGATRRLLLACDELNAGAALSCGLGNREGTLNDAVAWAKHIAALAPLTLTYSKRVLNQLFEPAVNGGTARELNEAFQACWTSEDFAEGRQARIERRPPRFHGR
jgi:enoyl-CoA hydratase